MEVKDMDLGNLIGRSSSSRFNIHLSKGNIWWWGYFKSSRFSDGIFIERFIDHEGKQVFHQDFQTCGIHGMMVWWHKSEADQRIEARSIKEVVAGSLDDPKEKWGKYAFVEVIAYGCRYHEPMLYLKSMIKRKDLLPRKNAGMHGPYIH